MSNKPVELPITLQLSDSYRSVNSVKKTINISCPSVGVSTYDLILPTNSGTLGQYLQTSGTGAMTWEPVAIESYTTVDRLMYIANPGTLVYDVDLAAAFMYDGTNWVSIGGGGGGGTVFADDVFRITDNTTPSKQLAFECSGITAATTRIITVPDRDFNLNYASLMDQSVAIAATPTLAGLSLKDSGSANTITLGAPALASGYSLTMPNALPGAATTGLLQSTAAGVTSWVNDLDADLLRIVDHVAPTKKIAFDASAIVAGTLEL